MNTIETDHLLLRPYEESDWEKFRALVQDDRVMWRLTGTLSEEVARRIFSRFLEEPAGQEMFGWAVTTKPAGEYCGHVFIDKYSRRQRSAELGFVLSKAFQGQGFGKEMAAAAYRFVHDSLGCNKVKATVDGDNAPAKAVLAGLGMSEVARESDEDGVFLIYSD